LHAAQPDSEFIARLSDRARAAEHSEDDTGQTTPVRPFLQFLAGSQVTDPSTVLIFHFAEIQLLRVFGDYCLLDRATLEDRTRPGPVQGRMDQEESTGAGGSSSHENEACPQRKESGTSLLFKKPLDRSVSISAGYVPARQQASKRKSSSGRNDC
jgi:hypothetical protein